MFFRILKKEIKQKWVINLILFVFMLLATIFVASSVNNIRTVSNATRYCLNKGMVGDIYVAAFEEDGKKRIGDWLISNPLVTDYSREEAIMLSTGDIVSFAGKSGDEYQTKGSIYLQKQWKKHMLVFNEEGNAFTLKKGEIAIAKKEMEQNGLQVGDTITLTVGNTQKTFMIRVRTMDPAFGGDFVGITRFLVSDADYQDLKKEASTTFYNYNIMTNQKDAFSKEMNREGFSYIVSIDKDMLAFTYIMSMIVAAILIVVGVCLILIAFLILRFTIRFTLQEEYKEIGIMKAIGIQSGTIKQIYLTKYVFLATLAAISGCFISIPISNAMVSTVKENILMEEARLHFGINILCTVLVWLFVLFLCLISMRSLKKFSAMEAIRSGQSGERYQRKSPLALYKTKKLPTVLFLSLNDILCNVKRYVVLVIIFIMGTLLIILPLNAITSMKSKEMAKNFAIDTEADFYLPADSVTNYESEYYDCDLISSHMQTIKDDFLAKGYEIRIHDLLFYSMLFYGDDEKDTLSVMTSYPLGNDGSYMEMLEGSIPHGTDEIACSEKLLDKMGLSIGDTVHIMIKGEAQSFLITGSYQNYMQMGVSALLSSDLDLQQVLFSGYFDYQCTLVNGTYSEEVKDEMQQALPQYELRSMQQVMEAQLGSTQDQLTLLKHMLILLICGINFLITALMVKIFIAGETGQIAILRSLGYSFFQIQLWQIFRMVILLIVGVVLGAVVSTPLNYLLIQPIFGLMGATHMKITANPLEVYLMYPLLLLAVVSVAVFISTLSIKKINIMEINSAE